VWCAGVGFFPFKTRPLYSVLGFTDCDFLLLWVILTWVSEIKNRNSIHPSTYTVTQPHTHSDTHCQPHTHTHCQPHTHTHTHNTPPHNKSERTHTQRDNLIFFFLPVEYGAVFYPFICDISKRQVTSLFEGSAKRRLCVTLLGGWFVYPFFSSSSHSFFFYFFFFYSFFLVFVFCCWGEKNLWCLGQKFF